MTLEIALTGINAASTELEVISNNIANNATTGFKRSRAEFADVYAVSSTGASGTAAGSGVRVTKVNQEFTQGVMTYTDNNLDVAISGEGFFRMDDHGSVVYTRSGSLGLDNRGFLVNSTGLYMTGFQANSDGLITSTLGNIQINAAGLPPKPTTEIELTLNLDPSSDAMTVPFDINDPTTYSFSTSTTMHDSLGQSHEATLFFQKIAPNEWASYTYVAGQEVNIPGGDRLVFNTDGTLQSLNGGGGSIITTTAFNPSPDASSQVLTIDIDAISQFVNPFGINKIVQNGHSAGLLKDLEIDSTGIIYGRYSNRESKPLGQIALTSFPNSQGLRPIGDTMFAETYGSGIGATNTPGSANLGLIQGGALEESNVDITEELVAMISAQRSFQANAQVISTADTLTQTVINIRR